MPTCNIRFCDNQKIDGNYTITNENVSYPFVNALDVKSRSKIFKATSNSSWRVTLDLGFPDQINTVCLFAPMGEALGITKEANIRLQADNINDFSSPEYDQVLSTTADNQLVQFVDTISYRYISLLIDDPTNNDFISFAYLYIGNYNSTTFRNIAPGFSWDQVDKSKVSKSLDGTSYYNEITKYDKFGSMKLGLVNNEDLEIIQDLYLLNGKTEPMPIAIDPESITVSSVNELTKLARFSSDLKIKHVAFNRYSIGFTLEEII